ncbi:10778_t:CDS:2 [Acaulospora morrowiae]|uniref:10778_t:CDS:1 n=1 Tax=Acaulospora morrowiae TaxID=94023 RepID=A0A9N8ZB44_9GLOM|nr:10778_t:CDS:2 [Acaulospora morrowiae]
MKRCCLCCSRESFDDGEEIPNGGHEVLAVKGGTTNKMMASAMGITKGERKWELYDDAQRRCNESQGKENHEKRRKWISQIENFAEDSE